MIAQYQHDIFFNPFLFDVVLTSLFYSEKYVIDVQRFGSAFR